FRRISRRTERARGCGGATEQDSSMKEIDELADLIARRAVEHEPDDELLVKHASFRGAVVAAIKAGEIDLAAKLANGIRQLGKSIGELPPEVEARAKRLRAETAAETFRAINHANATNHPLPAWVRAEIKE